MHHQWYFGGFNVLQSCCCLRDIYNWTDKRQWVERVGGGGFQRKGKVQTRGALYRERTGFVCLSVSVCVSVFALWWCTHFHCCFPQVLPHRGGVGRSCTLAPHMQTHTHTLKHTHRYRPHEGFVSMGVLGGWGEVKKKITKHFLLLCVPCSWSITIWLPSPPSPCLFVSEMHVCFDSDRKQAALAETKAFLPGQKPWHGTKQNSRPYFYPDWLEKCQRHCKAPWGNDDNGDDPKDAERARILKQREEWDWEKETEKEG